MRPNTDDRMGPSPCPFPQNGARMMRQGYSCIEIEQGPDFLPILHPTGSFRQAGIHAVVTPSTG